MTEKQKKLFELQLKIRTKLGRRISRRWLRRRRGWSLVARAEAYLRRSGWKTGKRRLGSCLIRMAWICQSLTCWIHRIWQKQNTRSGRRNLHHMAVFNQKTLYDAYKKRTKNIEVDMDAYNRAKETDPEFYREASSLQYGVAEPNIDRMVNELKERDEKRKAFSRRRKFNEDKDVDSINDRNEHFNKKIERAFGKYTLEIKNNLERGTALPD
ncbi:unnamed protein product [Triticum turgidum subsp. durum]|uniref:Pre-mRNA-splicing factor SYF2 n=1 Tax=Triticum turgidum subsp. durum TaxID=4567 RepID=A0A9R1C3A2_TRITD|nr:unnamed protein product [Triticum turgidum subsp. durum]